MQDRRAEILFAAAGALAGGGVDGSTAELAVAELRGGGSGDGGFLLGGEGGSAGIAPRINPASWAAVWMTATTKKQNSQMKIFIVIISFCDLINSLYICDGEKATLYFRNRRLFSGKRRS